ncbi:MAG: citrate transporter [Lachnospiraceae bacterium]|nr:citrate transporter [Lachnospiraceae bacterium]
MAKVKHIFKKLISDPVLIVAWVLAVISAFFVKPDKEYFGYIDWRSLGILWGLMVIIQGFKENSVFEKIAGVMLNKVKKGWQLSMILVLMCFFGSMLITNDVALITFVPFAIMILHECNRERSMIPVIVLQTVAANLGSMLTPIGNPQNLYMYGLTGMDIKSFVMLFLPSAALSLIMLIIGVMLVPGFSETMKVGGDFAAIKNFGSKWQVIVYCVLFVTALCSVLRIIPWYIMAIAILLVVFFMDYKILFRADYILLLTFIGFFVFTGNMGRIPAVKEFLGNIISGNEFGVSIIASQVISNVPATLMLSGFTTNYKDLMLGVNVGGLGTLIASMASLISYKAYTGSYKENRGKYLLSFTAVNVVFLTALIALHFWT